MQSLKNYLLAGYPLIAVSALDDQAVGDNSPDGMQRLSYSAAGVLIDDSTGEPAAAPAANWAAAFKAAADRQNCLLVVRDCQHVLKNPPIYRALLDCAETLKRSGSAIVLVAPSWSGGLIPPELSHSIALLDQPLPDREQLAGRLELIVSAAGIPEPSAELAAAILDGAAGLTADECENAIALSLVETGSLSPAIVQREKAALIRGSGFLSVEQPAPLDRVGGLGILKNYLLDQVLPNFRIPDLAVRGILLCGLPGVGKSLSAKTAAAALRVPLIRLDVGACKGSLVGQSEQNIRAATKLIESISPAVLWIDELEKAVGGFRSSAQTDGGTTLGMVGHLLTWLQEHDRPIFTVATCNDFNALPPELTRAGRFDDRFFVDLPTVSERETIAAVHLARFGCPVELARTIAQRTAEFTGAEIESLIKTAARLSGRAIKLADIETASRTIKPLAAVNPDFVREFRNWAKNTMRIANDPEPAAEKASRRAALADRN
jgi:hypothetical protein